MPFATTAACPTSARPSRATISAARRASLRSASEGCALRQDPGGREQIGEDVVGGADPEPLGLEDRRDQPQRGVVALFQPGQQPRGEADHGHIEPQRVEVRPAHAAGEDDRTAGGGAQIGEEPSGLLEARADDRVIREPVERDAVDPDDPVRLPRRGQMFGEQPRERAAAGDDRDSVGRHRVQAGGRVNERALSEVTNRTTSSTSGLPA
jgi:hypothetical protein